MNASTISRALSAAGVTKSQSRRGRIARITSEGFIAENCLSGRTLITYRKHSELVWSSEAGREAWLARKAEARKAIEAVLTAKALTFEIEDKDFCLKVWVGEKN